jgi:hypothetical protein
VFVGFFAAVQWPFADFLMSPAARNWFFGAHLFDYLTGPNSRLARGLFFEEPPRIFAQNMGLAFVFAILMSRLGIAWGRWMRGLQR